MSSFGYVDSLARLFLLFDAISVVIREKGEEERGMTFLGDGTVKRFMYMENICYYCFYGSTLFLFQELCE